ncbi:MAG: cell division protein FtsB [Candidatus Competibacter sp.]
MQILVAALIAVLTVMQYLLWVDEDGVRQTYALRISVQAQTEENAALNERNRALEADIKDLKTGLMAIEERARSEMGMIRQDETFYRLLEEPPSKSIAPDNPAPPPAVKPVAPPAKPANTAEAAPPTKPTAAKPPATTEKPATAAAKPGPSFKPFGQ